MADWDCSTAAKVRVNASTQHSKISEDGINRYGIIAKLLEVTLEPPHKAVLEVEFNGWGDAITTASLGPREYASYIDPDGIEWQVHVQALFLDSDPPPNRTSADVQICFEGVTLAKGEIISIDVPAFASEGDIIDLCATIKNVSGVNTLFFLRFYDGEMMLYESNTRWLEPAGEARVCAAFTMPGHEWSGKIELIR